MSTLKDLILGSDDINFRDVEIPEWGGITVRVKALNDQQLGEYQTKTMQMRSQKGGDGVDISMQNRRAEIVVKCLYDPETDERVFSDRDATKLAGKNAGVISGLFALINSLSGLDRSFEQRLDDAEGN